MGDAAIHDRETTTARLQDELASTNWNLEEFGGRQRRLADSREAIVRESARRQAASHRYERRLEEVKTAARSATQLAEEEEAEFIRQHDEAVACLRRQRNTEVSKLEAQLQQSILGLTEELSTVDSDANLRAADELTASAHILKERAYAHLKSGIGASRGGGFRSAPNKITEINSDELDMVIGSPH